MYHFRPEAALLFPIMSLLFYLARKQHWLGHFSLSSGIFLASVSLHTRDANPSVKSWTKKN